MDAKQKDTKYDLKKFFTNLEFALITFGYLDSAKKIKKISQKLPKFPYGEIPTFDWLKQGFLFRYLWQHYPGVYNELIEENSDILSKFDVKKYLGSGLVGDVWLLDNDRVLKIFDANAFVYNKSDSQKYEELADNLFEGKGDPGDPMIYELGDFEMVPDLYNIRSPSEKNVSFFRPAFVVMEGVKDFNSMVDRYLTENYDRMEFKYFDPEYQGEFPNEDEVYRPVTPDVWSSEVAMPKEIYSPDPDEYSKVVRDFMTNVMDSLIFSLISIIERYDPKEGGEPFHEDAEEGEEMIDFNNPDDVEALLSEMEYYADFGDVSEESLGRFEEMLGLENTDWIKELSKAILSNYLRGRKDLLSGNFGFRNGKVIFFDA